MQSFEIVSKIKVYSPEQCTGDTKNLIEKAKEATRSAYAPYSGYHVGAAVLLANGMIITGNNQENAAYPSGLCAERTALFYANSQYSDVSVLAVAIAAFNNGDFSKDVCTPCGSCRQVFVEIENRFDQPIQILMCSKDKVYEVPSIKELLPLSFEKSSLA